MKSYKEIREALKGKQHKLDVDKDGKIEGEDLAKLRSMKKEETELSEEDRIMRSDYKVSPSGRKSHKEIVFKTGDDGKKTVQEEMTDSQMKKREEIVKSMKKNLAGFKDRYGDRAKEVMYATATKMAMKEESIEEKKVPEATGDLKDACWKGYTAVGMKMKNGKKVPNCVPTNEEVEQIDEAIDANDYKATSEKSHFGGHRPHIVHKKTGKTMMLGQHSYKSPEHAKAHAHAYLSAYAKTGPNAADRAGYEYAKSNKDKQVTRKEEVELEEGFVVKYHDSKGVHKNTSRVFNDKEKANAHAAKGNSIDKVGGKYTVHKIDSEGRGMKEEFELEEQAPVAPVPGQKWKDHAVMVHKDSKQRVVVKRSNAKNYPEHEGWKEVAPGQKLKEEDEVKFSYQELMMMLEYESKSGVYRHTGSYGSEYAKKEREKDERGFDADDKEETSSVKRGRGRPAGSKSGARGPRFKK